MDNIQFELRDITGFDHLSNWPPAPIWWILAAIILLMMFIVILRAYSKILYKRSWQYDAAYQLSELDKHLDNDNAHRSLVQLSELIKRIIMKEYGREKCASLTGNKLLQWLKQQDPNNFDWPLHGKVILNKTYAPSDSKIDLKQIRVLISAIKKWVAYRGQAKELKQKEVR